MQFPKTFRRYVGEVPAGGKELGKDEPPTEAPGQLDNALEVRFSNTNGWPVQRLAVAYAGPAGAPSLEAAVLVYEDELKRWFVLDTGKLKPGAVTFFDAVALLDCPNASRSPRSPGSLELALVVGLRRAHEMVDVPHTFVETPGAGEYVFALGADISNPGR